MEQFIREYMTMLKIERNLARNSLESYQRDLNQYHSFLKDDLKINSIRNVTLGHIRTYVISLWQLTLLNELSQQFGLITIFYYLKVE
jgi:integrase/recombinase XerD